MGLTRLIEEILFNNQKLSTRNKDQDPGTGLRTGGRIWQFPQKLGLRFPLIFSLCRHANYANNDRNSSRLP